MKRIIISMLLLTILCTTILCGCTEDKEVATKDEVAVTTASTSVVTETTASEVVTSTSATETTVSTTTATTVAPEATKNVVSELVEVEDDDYENESYNSGSNNQNSNQSNNTSSGNNNSVSNNNSGYATKITLDSSNITLEVNETKEISFTTNGKVGSLNVTPEHFNYLTFEWVDTRTVAITAHRAGETSLTISADNGVSATCNVTINYPSVDNITYDTILSYDQINTEKVSKMVVDECNEYFATLGMTYDPSLNMSEHAWFIGHHCSAFGTDNVTINELVDEVIDCIMADVDAIVVGLHGCEYSDMRFNTVYCLDGDSYAINFCYG